MSFWIERDNPISGTMNFKIHTKEIPLYEFQNTRDKEEIDYKDFQRGKQLTHKRPGTRMAINFITATDRKLEDNRNNVSKFLRENYF